MKQTAVEWLVSHLNKQGFAQVVTDEEIKQAKEMEKQQIIESYNEGQQNPYEYSEDNDVNWYDGKKYYNETFKSE
jgi:predicted GNAT family acetyltransferase